MIDVPCWGCGARPLEVVGEESYHGIPTLKRILTRCNGCGERHHTVAEVGP